MKKCEHCGARVWFGYEEHLLRHSLADLTRRATEMLERQAQSPDWLSGIKHILQMTLAYQIMRQEGVPWAEALALLEDRIIVFNAQAEASRKRIQAAWDASHPKSGAKC